MKLKSKIFYIYGFLVVAYAALLLLPKPRVVTMRRYHLSVTGVRVLDVTIIVLQAIIWFAAFYGFKRLFDYSQAIGKVKEGKHLHRVAVGVMLLAVSLPINAIINSTLTLIASHNFAFIPASVMIRNYTNIVLPLLGFLFISIGARGLTNLMKVRPRLHVMNIGALAAIALGSVFASLIAHATQDLRAVFNTSSSEAILTVVLPYTYMWFIGLMSLAELHAYSHKLVGIVYRKSWNLVVGGLASVIVLSIVLQYLQTLNNWLLNLSLLSLLFLLYTLLFLMAAGYIVVALGTKKLIRIEEV